MNKFIRGLDDRKKLDRVLKVIGYRAIDEDLYMIDNRFANTTTTGHYVYLMDDNNICINTYESGRLMYLPMDSIELRFFICEDFMSIEILYIDNRVRLLQQLFNSNSKDTIEKILKELNDYLEEDEE